MSQLRAPVCVGCTKYRSECGCVHGPLIYPESSRQSFPNTSGTKRRRYGEEETTTERGKAKIQILGPNSQGVMMVMAREAPPASMVSSMSFRLQEPLLTWNRTGSTHHHSAVHKDIARLH